MTLFDKLLLLYVICVSLCTFVLCGYDKSVSKKKGRMRVPERAFFVLSFFGGSVGMMLGMRLFRHKTKHNSFKFGIPAILIIQIALFLLLKYH